MLSELPECSQEISSKAGKEEQPGEADSITVIAGKQNNCKTSMKI